MFEEGFEAEFFAIANAFHHISSHSSPGEATMRPGTQMGCGSSIFENTNRCLTKVGNRSPWGLDQPWSDERCHFQCPLMRNFREFQNSDRSHRKGPPVMLCWFLLPHPLKVVRDINTYQPQSQFLPVAGVATPWGKVAARGTLASAMGFRGVGAQILSSIQVVEHLMSFDQTAGDKGSPVYEQHPIFLRFLGHERNMSVEPRCQQHRVDAWDWADGIFCWLAAELFVDIDISMVSVKSVRFYDLILSVILTYNIT